MPRASSRGTSHRVNRLLIRAATSPAAISAINIRAFSRGVGQAARHRGLARPWEWSTPKGLPPPSRLDQTLLVSSRSPGWRAPGRLSCLPPAGALDRLELLAKDP